MHEGDCGYVHSEVAGAWSAVAGSHDGRGEARGASFRRRELGVPTRMCNLAYAEMREACNRGWEGRDSRAVMLLQQERAGVKIAADPERVKQAAERAKSG